MRSLLGTSVLTLLSSTVGYGATVAVIDSGVDTRHRDLSALVWSNAGEIASNGADDEGNGYVDDLYGWNFAENNNEVIDYSHLNTFSADCDKFFAIQGKVMLGTATDEEKAWVKAKREDQQFLMELQTFGNFVHGSHVAGISADSRSTERLIAIKIIPTKTPGLNSPEVQKYKAMLETLEADDPFSQMLIQFFLDNLVNQQVAIMQKAFAYAGQQGADVVNGSFGVSSASTGPAIKGLLSMLLGRDPTEEEVAKYSRYMIEKIGEACKEEIAKATKTLFVFAAGNDGADNDAMPVAPANARTDNAVSVAATLGIRSIATFSNWGASMVDVAAPGVVINSTIPGDKYLELSGTSMASPYVANVAALVKEANSALDPVAIKRILMETVDKKEWLTGKVRSGGVVNRERAVAAATLAKSQSLSAAIAAANADVTDVTEEFERFADADDSELYVVPLPSLLQ